MEYLSAIDYDTLALEPKIEAYKMYRTLKDSRGVIRLGSVLFSQTGDIEYLEDIAEANAAYGNLDEAIQLYSKLAELKPNDLTYEFHIGTLYLMLGDLGKAEKQYKKIYEKYPYRGQIETKLGRIKLLQGDIHGAKDHFMRAIYADVWEPSAHLGLASCYEILHDYDSAGYYYDQYLDFHQDDKHVWETLIDMYINNEIFDKAASTLAKYLVQFESDSFRYQQLGITSYIIGDFETALRVFKETSSWGDVDISLYSYLGKSAMELGQYALAESSFMLVRDQLVSPEPWLDLARLYSQMDSIDKAIETLNKIKVLFPDEPDIYYFEGTIYSRGNRLDEAITSFNCAYYLDTSDRFTMFALGDAYERSGNRDEAIKIFQELVTSYPEDPIILNYLGYILADEGIQLEYSIELIRKALNLDPENGAIIDSYGWVLFRLGEYDEASKQLEKALLYTDDDPVIYDHLGEVYASMNQNDLARGYWKKALEMRMNDATRISIQEKLDQLEQK
ncbi:tetratricopeptide repeat protein [bacterium]|nr:tetratricopeptide repeat protein [bacterium]